MIAQSSFLRWNGPRLSLEGMPSKVRLALCKARLIWAFSLDNQKPQIKVLCFRWVGLVRLGPGSDSAGLSSALGFRKTGLVPPLLEWQKRISSRIRWPFVKLDQIVRKKFKREIFQIFKFSFFCLKKIQVVFFVSKTKDFSLFWID